VTLWRPPAAARWPPAAGRRAVRPSVPFAAALVAVSVLATSLRIRHLTSVGFGSDEAVYARQGDALLASTADAATAWPGVRAHPPLLGLLLSGLPGRFDGDLTPRLLVVGLGVLTVVLTGLLGRRVGGPTAGLLAAGVLAVDPYHVDVTRQVLVDVPMAACVTAGLLAAASWLDAPSRRALVTAAACLGVATLFKETAALSAVAVLLVAAGVPRSRPAPGRAWALAAYAAVAGLYPVLLLVHGGRQRAAEYVGWQVARPSNADGWFYLTTVLPRVSALVVAAAAVGAIGAHRLAAPQRRLLVLAVVVPSAFYVLWPTKGYPYLTAVVPPLAVLAGTGLHHLGRAWVDRVTRRDLTAPTAGRRLLRSGRAAALVGAVLVAVPATARSAPPPVAGAGGVPAVREAARWLAGQPAGDVVTADAGIANIVRYYSDRRTTALPGDADASALNPAYRPSPATPSSSASSGGAASTDGPTYLVWDAWSAGHDPAGAAALVAQARRRDARVAHVEVGDLGRTGGPLSVVVVVFRVER
jgi:4-amino-4-deoxy-L-arabinose transferase-like glycosyltransferase